MIVRSQAAGNSRWPTSRATGRGSIVVGAASGTDTRLVAIDPMIAARFRDAAGRNVAARARISWGDGTSWNGTVLNLGGGMYAVRSTKRYARAGRYAVTVTVRDDTGRTSIARSTAIVSRRLPR